MPNKNGVTKAHKAGVYTQNWVKAPAHITAVRVIE